MGWTVPMVVLMLMVLTARCLDNNLDGRWEKYKTDNNRHYEEDVEPHRRAIWEGKVKEIEQHNGEADQGHHTYWMKETEWDDLTYNEFMKGNVDVNAINRNKRASVKGTGDCFTEEVWADTFPYDFNTVSSLPDNVDWSQKGFVTEVKNQGSCGACWAFSAVGAIEGQWYKKTKQLTSLSPQALMDCSTGNYGCNGGLPSIAHDYVKRKGIAAESAYPYTAKKGRCVLYTVSNAATITGYKTVDTEDELLNALAYVGPVSAGISTGPRITNIGQGVFSDCTGGTNHAVLVVGYGLYNGKKVWKIKNSWGSSWGNDGYFYLTREVPNACGIARYASYPTVGGVTRGPVRAGEVGPFSVLTTSTIFQTTTIADTTPSQGDSKVPNTAVTCYTSFSALFLAYISVFLFH